LKFIHENWSLDKTKQMDRKILLKIEEGVEKGHLRAKKEDELTKYELNYCCDPEFRFIEKEESSRKRKRGSESSENEDNKKKSKSKVSQSTKRKGEESDKKATRKKISYSSSDSSSDFSSDLESSETKITKSTNQKKYHQTEK